MGTMVTFYDPASGASINYMDRYKGDASPDAAALREIHWPDGATAIQDWPIDGVDIDEAPHPAGIVLEAFDPGQARAPKGSPDGGQWVSESGSSMAKDLFGKVKDHINEDQHKFFKSLTTMSEKKLRDMYTGMTGDVLGPSMARDRVRAAVVETWLQSVSDSIDEGQVYK